MSGLALDVSDPGDPTALIPPGQRTPAATSTTRAGALDTLTLHVSVTTVAVFIGWLLMTGIRALHPALGGFPRFPLSMIGGILVQLGATRIGTAVYFDRATFERIMGLSLDVLIVAAIASLRLDLFLQNVVPFTLLMLDGIAGTLAAFFVLAPRMIQRDWFEQSITLYEMVAGVTAIGLMLLRIVDPENRTTGAPAFAAQALVVSPLVGGGFVTATIPILLVNFGLPVVLAGVTGVVLVFMLWPGPGGCGRAEGRW